MRFSAKAQKVFGGDLIVNDVCASCNNGPLSALDAYACSLYESHFSKIINADVPVKIQYDHDLLLRWLLKVSYNSSRLNQQDVAFHTPLIPYMLGQVKKPEFVSATLDIVIPSIVDGVILEPRAARCAQIFIGQNRPWVCIRLVAVNSYYFYIIITSQTPIPVSEGELLEFRRGIKGKFLQTLGRLELVEHKSNVLDMHAPHLLQNSDLYDEFIAKYRRMH